MEVGSKVDIEFETDLTSNPIYELRHANYSKDYVEIDGTSIIAHHANSGSNAIPVCIKFYHTENNWTFYIINIWVVEGHSYIERSVSQEPTCTENGKMLCTCSVCGDANYKDIPTIDHSYESVVTQNPTCCKEGIQTNTCTVCGG